MDYQHPVSPHILQEERKGVTCNRLSEDDIPNSRGKAHLIIKFGGVTGTLNIVDVKGLTVGKLTAEDEKPAALASFECRGLEVVRFHPGSGFRVTSEDGTVFENVDLSDAEGWSDYCEKGKKPVSIVNFSTTIGSRP